MRNLNDLSDLIYRIYDTVGNGSDAWRKVLDELFRLTHAHMGSVMRFNNGGTESILMGCGEHAQQDYLDYFIERDPWVAISHSYQVRGGEAIEASHELVPDSTFHTTEFYHDFARKVGYGYGFGIAIDGGEGSKTVISGVRDSHPFSEEEFAWLSLLRPHLRQALRLGRTVNEARVGRASLLQCIDQLHRGILLTDGFGKVIAANRAAERMTSCGDGLSIVEGRLRTRLARDTDKIQALLSGVVHTNSGGGTVFIVRSEGRKPWVITVTRFANFAQQGLGCLVITDPEAALSPDEDVVSQLYGFTPAETRLSRLVVNGDRLDAAATKLGITMNTVRTHLKRMLSKAGVRSQAELVAALSRIPPKAATADCSADQPQSSL